MCFEDLISWFSVLQQLLHVVQLFLSEQKIDEIVLVFFHALTLKQLYFDSLTHSLVSWCALVNQPTCNASQMMSMKNVLSITSWLRPDQLFSWDTNVSKVKHTKLSNGAFGLLIGQYKAISLVRYHLSYHVLVNFTQQAKWCLRVQSTQTTSLQDNSLPEVDPLVTSKRALTLQEGEIIYYYFSKV